MRFETFVALRYLAASRRRAHVALIATISIAGLAIGVAALIVSLALLSGFQDRIRRQMTERSAHLRVSPARGATLPDAEARAARARPIPGVVEVVDSLEGRAWASDVGRHDDRARPLPQHGGPARPGSVDGARISSTVGARLHVAAGDLVRLSSSRTRLSPIGPVPISVVLPVLQARRVGMLEKAPDVEVSEETARTLSGLRSGAFALEARLRDPGEAESAARLLRAALPAAYRVETWRDRNAPLAFALRLEKVVIFVTVALVILVAALNVVSNIALTVVEKKRDLGVFTAMGAAPSSLQRVYLTLGAVIGVIGTAVGTRSWGSASRSPPTGISSSPCRPTCTCSPTCRSPCTRRRSPPSPCSRWRRRSPRRCFPRARRRGSRRARRSGCRDDASGMTAELAVRAENLSKTYTGEGAPVRVFSNLSFELPAGEFAAVMGPSGVGKSTLLHLLGGIDRADSGRVEVFGRSLDEMTPKERARFRNETIGFVFQFHHLLPEFTAEENVAFPERIAGASAARRVEARGGAARERRARRPARRTARAPSRAASSSESRSRERSPAGRGSCSPTSRPAISTPRRRPRVFDLLRSLHPEREMTTVLVTHNPDLANRCDKIFTMTREGIAPARGLSERG